jgi:hypothetical protein
LYKLPKWALDQLHLNFVQAFPNGHWANFT